MENPAPQIAAEPEAPFNQDAASGSPAQDLATVIPTQSVMSDAGGPVATTPVVLPPGATAEQIAVVFDTYRKEFGETIEGLRQRSAGLQDEGTRLIAETSASIEPIKQDIIDTITSTTDVATPSMSIVSTFAWASVLVFAASVASVVGSYILAPIVGIFVGKAGGALLAGFAMPVVGHYMVRKAAQENTADSQTRFSLLSVALVQGLLTGFVLADTYVSAQPFAFLFPAVIAVAYPFIQKSVGANRVNLLVASAGAALAFNLALGFVAGSLTSTYVFLTLLYTAAATVVMQLMFRNVQTPEQRVHLYQLAVLASFVAVKLIGFGIAGGNREDIVVHNTKN